MKTDSRRGAGLAALSLAVLAAASALVLGAKAITAWQRSASEEEIASSLREFWAAARANDLGTDEALGSKYLTKVPNDFNRKCDESSTPPSPEPEALARAKATGIPVVSVWGANVQIEGEWVSVKHWAGLIHKNQYEVRSIILKRFEGDEAVVFVNYGNEAYPYDGALLLLRREEGRWKIFMDTHESFLNESCKSFAGGNK